MFKTGVIYQWLTRGAVTADHAEFLFQLRKRRITIRILQIAILLAFIGLWELMGQMGWINTFLMSQPSKILNLFIKMCQNGQLYHHIKITLTENIIGFSSGTILGILIAILLWWSDFLFNLLEPYLVILNSIPKVALGPVMIVWLGNDSPAIIVMALAVSIIVTIIMLINGFREVESNKIKLLQTLGATKKQILFKVILPASVPTIFSALKVSVGLSLVGTIVGEFLVSKAGLGYLIVYGGQVFNLHLVMTSVIILCIIAGLMYYFVLLLEKLIIKWR
ncbi:MAG: NitT/TauT family transport system permease protein [Halanaerobiales bacterium]|nr:NitT/TauT family transport system permease protein [Halanaerobiales bacterium]